MILPKVAAHMSMNTTRLLGLSMSDFSVALVAIAIAALMYVLCRVVDDWLEQEMDLVPSSGIVRTGILSLFLWYGVYCAQNATRALQNRDRITMGLLSLVLLLFALFLWHASES